METMKLFAYQQPSKIGMLLESLILAQDELPSSAHKVMERSDLPSVLQKLVLKVQKSEGVWSAWAHREHIWLFTAEMSLPLSRERGCPALQVASYNEAGRMQAWRLWVRLTDGSWQQCTL